MGKQEGVKGPNGCLGGRGETNNLGITLWVESRGFWLTYLLSVSSFPASPNLASSVSSRLWPKKATTWVSWSWAGTRRLPHGKGQPQPHLISNGRCLLSL